MTKQANGQLEESAQERVDLWENAERSIASNPILGTGFATFQFGEHVDNLSDTHNWYVKVLVETGIIGFTIVLIMFQQLFAVPFRLFRKAEDPLYKGLGLGLLLAMVACAIANLFGDRWTYLEITGLLWVLVAAALRAAELGIPEDQPAYSPMSAAAGFQPASVVFPGNQQPARLTEPLKR
jgi:O-antigen ligase